MSGPPSSVLRDMELEDIAAGDPRMARVLRDLGQSECERLNRLTLADLVRGAAIELKLAGNGDQIDCPMAGCWWRVADTHRSSAPSPFPKY